MREQKRLIKSGLHFPFFSIEDYRINRGFHTLCQSLSMVQWLQVALCVSRWANLPILNST